MLSTNSHWNIGVARRIITPGKNVELAGLGYYLNRTATSVRDDLAATALVIEGANGKSIALIALELMYADENFTRSIRDQISSQTSLAPARTSSGGASAAGTRRTSTPQPDRCPVASVRTAG